MRILCACAESPKNKLYTSNDSLIQAFRDLGHEVITAGPVFENYEGDLTGVIRDIRVHDKRTHPETWTYKEILDQCDKKPDIILQMDPHFYFVGEKPKDIICAYYVVDVHRGADVFRKMALAGNFDYVFLAHKYFMPIYERVGLNCFWLPRAFDDNYMKEYPEIKIECDISFVGENGFGDKINTFNMFDAKIGSHYHEGPYPPASPQDKYRSWENHSMEYAERAEILYRLSKDFNLRVYPNHPNNRGPNYAKIINRGKITVNHSLWYDSALRNFEVLAANRFLVTDMLPNQDELLIDGEHYLSYNHYFLPFLDNFKLEYEEIKEKVEWVLRNENLSKVIIEKGCNFVKKYHTFKHRAQIIIDVVTNKKLKKDINYGVDLQKEYATHGEMWGDDLRKLWNKESGIGCGGTILDYDFIDIEIKDLRILEIGFGAGELAKRLIEENEYWGIDIGLGSFKDVFKNELDKKGGRFLRLDASKDILPIVDNYFDMCFILETIEHLSSPYHCIEEIKRVLRPGGRFIVIFPRPESNIGYDGGKHAHIYPAFLIKKSFRMFMRQMYFKLKNYRINGDSAYYLYENIKPTPIIRRRKISPYIMTHLNHTEKELFEKLRDGEWGGEEPEYPQDCKTYDKIIEPKSTRT